MTYNPVPTVEPGESWSASQHNTYLRDNFAALWPYVSTGDIAYLSAPNVLARLALVTGGLLYGGASNPAYLAKPAGLGFLQNDNAGALAWKTGGNAYEVIRKNAANNGYEFAPIGAWSTAKRSSDLTGLTTSETIVTWNASEGQSWWATTKLTAPVAGDYRVSANINFETASVWRNYTSRLMINGVEISVSKMWSESNYIFTGVHPGRILTLAAGDYLQATVDNCNGRVYAGSWIQMERVR